MWIRTYEEESADERTRRLYARVCGPGGQVDNILRLHGLRPHTLEGHMALYKAVLHHTRNHLPLWMLEGVGVLVSALNRCDYCVKHHAEGLRRALGDEGEQAEGERAEQVLAWVGEFLGEQEPPTAGPDPRLDAAFRYARALTLRPSEAEESDVEALRRAGFDDGEILELNQVVSYFAYANRTVLGLGATTEGEVLGLHPDETEDLDQWGHV